MDVAKLVDQAQKNICKKYKALKAYDAQLDYDVKKTYAPLIQPLETISKKEESKRTGVSYEKFNLIDLKDDEKKADHLLDLDESPRGAKRKQADTSFFGNQSLIDSDTKRQAHSPSNLSQFGPIAKQVFEDLSNDPKKYDKVFGPKVDGNTHKLGCKRLIIYKNDNLSIISKTFKGSKGLYTLIYYKKPPVTSYTQADETLYREIWLYIHA